MPNLGVNIDHVATLRQARMNNEPDPVWAAAQAELGGADCITIHLREDRRHIQDRDFLILHKTSNVKLNLEMACDPEIVRLACENPPGQVTLVPEKREELTTEGGLDMLAARSQITETISQLKSVQIPVSLFLDPSIPQIEAGIDAGADAIELHTGTYANAGDHRESEELYTITRAAEHIHSAGVILNAGHGLNYMNVLPIASIPYMHELNIGHSIIARAVFTGLSEAVREMKHLIAT